jgi:RNA polymerase sigma factor (sigma-70 family)
MATNRVTTVLEHLRRAVGDETGATDARLLGHFIERRDEEAFAALVRRHGPMVWGVCRRLLNNLHDAEDAFQATFLVLVRKASSVAPRAMVGNWLYGVAYHTAVRARSAAAKRRTRERQVAEMPEPVATAHDPWRDLQPVLDLELSRLPNKYRAPVLLCDVEGKTRKEAARQLGWPEGTLSGRLARARVMLAKRLGRHGLPLTAGALAAALSANAVQAAPAALVAATVRAGGLLAAGGAAAAAVSANVSALSEGVVKAMLMTKLKIATVLLAAVAVVGAGAGLMTTRGGSGSSLAAAQDDGQPILRETDKPAPAEAKRLGGEPEKKDVWRLDFHYKSMTVSSLNEKKQASLTIHYQVCNNTGAPQAFVPYFECQARDKQPMAADHVVANGKGVTGLKNAVIIASEQLPPDSGEKKQDGVQGTAAWDNLDLDCESFSIFVGGLSNAQMVVEPKPPAKEPVVYVLMLQMDFTRGGKGNHFTNISEPQWVYRPKPAAPEGKYIWDAAPSGGRVMLGDKVAEPADAEMKKIIEEARTLLDARKNADPRIAQLLAQLEQALERRDQARLNLEVSREVIAQCEKELREALRGAAKGRPGDREAENKKRDKEITDLVAAIESIEERVKSWQRQRDALRDQLESVDLSEKKEQVELEKLRKRLADLRQAPAKDERQGAVLEVFEGSLLLVSLGSDHGVKKGDRLEIYRLKPDPLYVGNAEVIDVSAGRSVVRMNKSQKVPAVGDQVSTRLFEKH